MASTATRANMRLRAQRRADLETTAYIATDEWDNLLDLGAGELHDLLVATSEDYFVGLPWVPTLVSGTTLYTLPDDFFKVLQVDVIASTSYRYGLSRIMPGEHAFWQQGSGCAGYRIFGTSIEFLPGIPVPGTVEVRYAPQFKRLQNDEARLHPAIPEGWDEYPVLYAAARAKTKQRVDASDILGLLADLRDRIKQMAPARDTNEQARVVDVSNRFGRDRWYYDLYGGRGW